MGGIEAEAVMLGQPLYMLMPEVVGFEITGELPAGATATDLVLTVTQILRKEGVVGKFVEFFGPGVSRMKLADRATIGNMAPEYGATMGFFPIDEPVAGIPAADRPHRRRGGAGRTIYAKEQQLFRTDDGPMPQFTKTLRSTWARSSPAWPGPSGRRIGCRSKPMKETFRKALRAPIAERGFALDEAATRRTGTVVDNGPSAEIGHGAVVIAAITSCTNTSNPSVMLAAGLLAKKAVARGLKVKSYVKPASPRDRAWSPIISTRPA